MTIAELFVNLGVKGADKSKKSIEGVKSSLVEVKDSSLAAKAGILAAIYGLEQMMAHSARFGTSMLNFSTQTGLSAQNLQKLQYAARLAGVESQELEGSIRGVQDSMTKMLLGKGAPEGLGMLANKVGFDPKRARDTYYVFEQITKLAQQVPPDIATALIKSFGVSENTIAAMMRGSFNPSILKTAPTFSDNQLGELNKVDVAWARLKTQVEMAFGSFTSKHGLQIVKDIAMITTEVAKLADTLMKLAEKYKIFEVIDETVKGLTMALRLLNGESVEEVTKSDKGKRKFGEGTWWSNAINSGMDQAVKIGETFKDAHILNQRTELPATHQGANVTVNQNITHVGDAKDTAAVKQTHETAARHSHSASQKAIKHAFRQSPALAGGH